MQKRKSERERNRERERRARGNRKYGQAKLKHAKRGILSCVVAAVVGLLLIILIGTAYKNAGTSGAVVGGLALSAMIFSGIGVYGGFRGFREREKEYITCKIGIGLNILYIVGFIAIFCRGLF